MGSLQTNGKSKASKYDTTVTVTSGVASSPGRSQEDFEKTDGDAESEDGILPIQNHNIGVVRTVRISVA